MIVRGLFWLVVTFTVSVSLGAMAGRPGASVPSLLGSATQSPTITAPKPSHLGGQSQNIHPAVVRVVAPGKGSVSYGSGTLVDVNGDYGLVITNHHVIDESTGNISVIFPDGFYSLATVRKIDRDWDLAALVIKRPNVTPVSLANVAPRPGEPLTIAGYGSGNYRAVAGRCTQYVAPDRRMPFEMVELAASARQGDSGGPILNSRGELAGVLFGEGGGRTAGSYCGRVKWFLASLIDRPNLTPPPPMKPFESPPIQLAESHESPPLVRLPQPVHQDPPEIMARPSVSFAARPIETRAPSLEPSTPQTGFVRSQPQLFSEPVNEQLSWSQIAGDTFADQVKTFLAIVGSVAVLMCALKVVGGSG